MHADTHGTHYVGLCIPMGRLTDDGVVRGRAPGAHARRRRRAHVAAPEPAAHRRPRRRRAARRDFVQTYKPEADPFERAIVACTSAPFCKFAIDDMKTNGRKLVAHLQENLPVAGRDRLEGLRLHMSGCKASCAQVQAAHIGVRATMTKDEEAYQQALDISLGGDLGASRLGQWVRLEEPVDEAFDSDHRGAARGVRRRALAGRSDAGRRRPLLRGRQHAWLIRLPTSAAARRSGARRARRHHGCRRRARDARQDLVPQDRLGRDRRRPLRRLRRVHRRVPLAVDRHRRRRPAHARADVHRLLGVLGLLPDGRLPPREAEPPGRRGSGRSGAGGRLGPRGRAPRRRAGRRRGHDAARHPDGARRDRRRDPDAEARRVHRHAGAGNHRRAGADRRRQRLPPVRDPRDPERALPRGRRADRAGRHAVPDQRPARAAEVPVGEPRHAGDQGDACDRAVLHALVRPEEAAADGGRRGRAAAAGQEDRHPRGQDDRRRPPRARP